MNNFHVVRYLTEITKCNIIYPCTIMRVIRGVAYTCAEKRLYSCSKCDTYNEFYVRRVYD